MKEAVVLVLVAVLIVGGIGIWLANGNSIPFFSNSQASVVQPAGETQPGTGTVKETAPAQPLKAARTKAAKKTPGTQLSEAAPEPPMIQPLAEVVVAQPAPKQFPTAKEIANG